MRRANVEMRASNNAVDTVHAAANAIASAESRSTPPSSQKRRWGGFLSMSCCFGSQSHKYSKRIGHAVLVPEATTTSSAGHPPPGRSLGQPVPIIVPFAAPPSSPTSFLPSGPPSTTHSPAGLVSLTSISANMYSPGGPRSIFAVGPYAHETQVVSPPIFSTYTTEPSTAPFTPPPESVHLTTPSSPEVPFAQLLDPSLRNGDIGQRFAPSHSQYEYQMYHYYPGSPRGQLISPGSAISGSGTSSPFPDYEYYAGGLHYPDNRFGGPPKLKNLQSFPCRDWGSSHHGSGTLTPDPWQDKSREGLMLDRQDSTVSPLLSLLPESAVNQRVSFELTAEDVVRCVEKGRKSSSKALQTATYNNSSSNSSSSNSTNIDKTLIEEVTIKATPTSDVEEGHRCQKQRSVSLGSIKEFNFDHGNREEAHKPCNGSYWWANA